MANLEKRNITRVNMNLPTKLVEEVKIFAEDLGLPTTQAYTVLINYALEYKEMLNTMPQLLNAVNDLKVMYDNEKQKELDIDIDQ